MGLQAVEVSSPPRKPATPEHISRCFAKLLDVYPKLQSADSLRETTNPTAVECLNRSSCKSNCPLGPRVPCACGRLELRMEPQLKASLPGTPSQLSVRDTQTLSSFHPSAKMANSQGFETNLGHSESRTSKNQMTSNDWYCAMPFRIIGQQKN